MTHPMWPSAEAGRKSLLDTLAGVDGPIVFVGYSQYEGDIRDWIADRMLSPS